MFIVEKHIYIYVIRLESKICIYLIISAFSHDKFKLSY